MIKKETDNDKATGYTLRLLERYNKEEKELSLKLGEINLKMAEIKKDEPSNEADELKKSFIKYFNLILEVRDKIEIMKSLNFLNKSHGE